MTTNKELEDITGMNPKMVYAKNVLHQVLDQMCDRYGTDVTSDALCEVIQEIYDVTVVGVERPESDDGDA